MRKRILNCDVLALLVLVLLWGLFFWRILTPIPADRASFAPGDFSGQFYAFGAYQYERMSQGEVPLWNPYNNGGFPFIGDTQAAVFYPPRLLNILISQQTGGWTYHGLQLEGALHVLVLSMGMYAFVRRLTISQKGSVAGALAAAIMIAYGGWAAGYPILQLALLEAAVWLPLAALAILEATRATRVAPGWIAVAGVFLGMSWLAGHPQTSFFLTYLLVFWLVFRLYQHRTTWRAGAVTLALFGLVTFGVTAITFLPSAEYLIHASRTSMSYDAKGNGFPPQDVLQMIYPGVMSLFSPMYIGLTGLLLAICGMILSRQALFWIGTALFALVLSFGINTAFYAALYQVVPGLRFFRGQERAVLLMVYSLAVLAGLGLAAMNTRAVLPFTLRIRGVLLGLTLGLWIVAVATAIAQQWGLAVQSAFLGASFLAAMAGSALLAIVWFASERGWSSGVNVAVIGLLVLELFSVNMNAAGTYTSGAPAYSPSSDASRMLLAASADKPQPSRIDGFRGIEDNNASALGLMDIRGISPLFLQTAYDIIYRDYVFNPLAWEVFAVRHVFSEYPTFGEELPSNVLGSGNDRQGPYYLHELQDPRPFALLVYEAEVIGDPAAALARMDALGVDLRDIVVLATSPSIIPAGSGRTAGNVVVSTYAPEEIEMKVSAPADAILSIAQVNYPGWEATIDGVPAAILPAYQALSAIAVPSGDHVVRLWYDPLSYRIGVVITASTWILLFLSGIGWMLARRAKQ